jgi:tetratricopeptide (TPR) repeat protein
LGKNSEGAIVITLRNEDRLKLDIATGNASHMAVQDLKDDPKRMLHRAYTMDREPQEAIALLRKVITLESKNIPAWRLLGEDLTRTRECQAVVDAMKTAIDTVPPPGKNDNDWTTYLYLFIIRSKAEKELKNPAAAEATLLKCISIDPAFEDSVFTLGNFLYDQGRGDEADRFLRQSYEVKVEHNKLFSYMDAKRFGDFYHSRRLHEKAKTYYLK